MANTSILGLCGLCASMLLAVGCDAPSNRELLEDEAAAAQDEQDEQDELDDEEDAASEDEELVEDEPASDEPVEAWLVPPRAGPQLEGACDVPDAMAQCHVDGVGGEQFCDFDEWGPCVIEPECEPGDTYEYECMGTLEAYCYLDEGVPTWDDNCFTPLVLSFDGAEPTFSAAASSFELSAGTGKCLAREMPTADTPWLAIDLDGSGAIENGRELFGSASPMAHGRRAENGFDALREHDTDGDGRITLADPVWGALVLWSDYDLDRQSSAVELMPVAHAGLTSIELDHVDVPRCDDRGNCGIERASFGFVSGGFADGPAPAAAGPTTGTVIDVHIPCD